MKKFFTIAAALLSAVIAQAQSSSVPADSTLTILRMPDTDIVLAKPVFTLPLVFRLSTPEYHSSLPLYQSFAGVPQSFVWDRSYTADLTAPLRLQLRRAESDRPWKMTLGAAGTAGAFYIAYKHLKKYGFK